MDLKLNVSKKGLSTQEEVINEEYTLRYGHIFRGKSAYEYAVEGGFVGSEEEYEAYVGNIGNLSEEAKEATIEAKEAVIGAQDAREQALVAADMASSAGTRADKATENAENATQTALDAAERANKAAENAESSIITIDKELSPTSDNAIANSAVVNGLAGLAEGVSTTIGQVSEQLGAEIETKAAKDGYYPDMSVGMADNLIGRGDVQDAHINFRPSAGADNITDGAARIERIKGNSVVYNQVAKNADFRAGTSYWGANNTTLSMNADGSMRVTNNTGHSQGITQTVSIQSNHKMLVIMDFCRSSLSASQAVVYMHKVGGYDTVHSENFSYDARRKIGLFIESSSSIDQILIYPFITGEIGSYTDLYYCRVIDLTKMFGAGNEPTSYEEYLLRKPMNIEDEFAYNEGTLVDMHADKLVSTGDNAYDYTKGYARVMGGYKYDITANAGATLEVSFYADGEDDNEEREIAPDSEGKYTFPANGICYVNGDFASRSDVCVCLNHSYDKPHPAYQQDVKDLGWIWEIQDSEGNLLFPNGMRSAGSAYDEIRFNPTKKVWEKVERVGVRAYAEGDAEDSSVITDGETTNYPLDNPTPTTINLSPNFNLDYLVWDFGTEEAIASVPSTPFRADIQYGDNFVDDIRKNKEDIATNKANIAKNASALNSKQNTLTLTTKPNGNIVIGNLAGQSKEFMPATPSGDPMHYAYLKVYGLSYDETTGLWAYRADEGGLTDLTTTEVQNMWIAAGGLDEKNSNYCRWARRIDDLFPARTNICSTYYGEGQGYANADWNFAFNQNPTIEVAVITNTPTTYSSIAAQPCYCAGMFAYCYKLRRIIGGLSFEYIYKNDSRYTNMFMECPLLESVEIWLLNRNLGFPNSPLLSKESLLFMINNCASNAKFTITLHPDVYAKCTRVDEGEEQYEGEWWVDIDTALGDAVEGKNTTITLASA